MKFSFRNPVALALPPLILQSVFKTAIEFSNLQIAGSVMANVGCNVGNNYATRHEFNPWNQRPEYQMSGMSGSKQGETLPGTSTDVFQLAFVSSTTGWAVRQPQRVVASFPMTDHSPDGKHKRHAVRLDPRAHSTSPKFPAS